MKHQPAHTPEDITRAVSRFFAVRGLVRTTLAQGKRLHPSAWLHIETLKFIADHRDPSMKEVADYLSITAPSATSLITGLVREGYVVRRTDPRDRRAFKLTLTAKGRRFLTVTIARGTELLGALFASLSPKELAHFIHTLERLLKAGE